MCHPIQGYERLHDRDGSPRDDYRGYRDGHLGNRDRFRTNRDDRNDRDYYRDRRDRPRYAREPSREHRDHHRGYRDRDREYGTETGRQPTFEEYMRSYFTGDQGTNRRYTGNQKVKLELKEFDGNSDPPGNTSRPAVPPRVDDKGKAPMGQNDPFTCYYCQDKGRIARDCPHKKKLINVAEKEEVQGIHVIRQEAAVQPELQPSSSFEELLSAYKIAPSAEDELKQLDPDLEDHYVISSHSSGMNVFKTGKDRESLPIGTTTCPHRRRQYQPYSVIQRLPDRDGSPRDDYRGYRDGHLGNRDRFRTNRDDRNDRDYYRDRRDRPRYAREPSREHRDHHRGYRDRDREYRDRDRGRQPTFEEYMRSYFTGDQGTNRRYTGNQKVKLELKEFDGNSDPPGIL
ncbi:uncharacterized protein DDB_G0283697-like [Telopea speciosissima]|uniref:uncharacterized protein DDB_G0283697-like n=1 Tax=Telopea speciosissima TaxID=54955 RepID=UPI001CC728F1|nr:uncharacterized protein DDB_G0283697-like [Telopea speciosissima]